MRNNCQSVNLVEFLLGFKVRKFEIKILKLKFETYEVSYMVKVQALIEKNRSNSKIDNFLHNFSVFRKVFILMPLWFDIEKLILDRGFDKI